MDDPQALADAQTHLTNVPESPDPPRDAGRYPITEAAMVAAALGAGAAVTHGTMAFGLFDEADGASARHNAPRYPPARLPRAARRPAQRRPAPSRHPGLVATVGDTSSRCE
jgi:hypothetical protein